MAAYINISLQGTLPSVSDVVSFEPQLIMLGTVYFAARRSAEDDGMLRLFSSKLVGVAKGE